VGIGLQELILADTPISRCSLAYNALEYIFAAALDASRVDASRVEHSVEDRGGDGELNGAGPAALETQSIADDLLRFQKLRGLGPGTPIRERCLPEKHWSLLQAVVAPPHLDEMRHDL
jgi:hypothetical protein